MKKSIIELWTGSTLEEKFLWLYTALIPFSDAAYFLLGAKRISYPDIVFLGLSFIWLIKFAQGKAIFRKTSMELPLILMSCLFLVSFINSADLFSGFIEMAGLVYLIIVFVLVVNIVTTLQSLRRLLNIYVFISAVISFVGLFYVGMALTAGNMGYNRFLQYTTIESVAHHFPRINLTSESPNMMLSYLHVALIGGIILFVSEKRMGIKFLHSLSITAISMAAFFTGSRRITGLLLSLFIILCLIGRGRIMPMVKYGVFLGFLFFLTTSIITSIWVVFPVMIENDKDTKTIALKANKAYSLHFAQPVASINMFKKHPVIGVGFGTYILEIQVLIQGFMGNVY